MAEGFPAEAAPNPAECQDALRHFFDTTAAELYSGSVWLQWAEHSQMAAPETIAVHRADLMKQATENTDFARDIVVGWQQAGITVWVNHAQLGPSIMAGVQYQIGQPWYHAGINNNGQMLLVPLNAEHPLEVRAPGGMSFLPLSRASTEAASLRSMGSVPHIARLSTSTWRSPLGRR
jgi:hypothetical protein